MPSSCSPCPSKWPAACPSKPVRCSPTPESTSLSPGNPRSTGPPGIPWPGPDPDGISPEDLHPLIRAGLPVRAIAARLSASADHVPAGSSPPPGAPASRRDPLAAPGRTRTTRHRTAPRPHQPGIRCAQDRPHHRVQRANHQAAPHQRRAPPPGPAPGRRHRPALAPRALPGPPAQPEGHRHRDRRPRRGPRRRSPQGRHPRPARHQRPRPPPRRPRRTRRVHHGRLERLHPPRRRAAHPKAPHPPRPAQPPARSPPARHQDRHPHQPAPPARDHRRHRPAAHRARRAAHADRLRPALRPRRPPRPRITRPVSEPGHQTSRPGSEGVSSSLTCSFAVRFGQKLRTKPGP